MPRSHIPPRRPLSNVPDALRDRLTPEQRREVADFGADLQRRHRDRANGRGPMPLFLSRVEAEAPGAGRLWMALDAMPPGSAERLIDVGARLGLSSETTGAALDALRRAELVVDAPGGVRAITPGGAS